MHPWKLMQLDDEIIVFLAQVSAYFQGLGVKDSADAIHQHSFFAGQIFEVRTLPGYWTTTCAYLRFAQDAWNKQKTYSPKWWFYCDLPWQKITLNEQRYAYLREPEGWELLTPTRT